MVGTFYHGLQRLGTYCCKCDLHYLALVDYKNTGKKVSPLENFAAAVFFLDADALRPGMPREICFILFTGGINREREIFFSSICM